MSTPEGRVEVIAPARLHMGFVDLHGGLGRRYGSLGVALERPLTRISLERAERVTAHGADAARAERFAATLLEHLAVPAGVRIEVHEAIRAHAGLGSGTQLALAVGAGLARLLDLDIDRMRVATALGRGGRSGLGIGLFASGGFLVDGGTSGRAGSVPPVVARLPFPAAWRLLLVFDRGYEGVHGDSERTAFAGLPRFPEADAAMLCRAVLMGALPGIAEADLEAFGRAVGRIQQRIGDHFAEAQGGRFASPAVTEVLEWLRARGLHGVGQSSWGPTGFAVCQDDDEARALLAAAESRFAAEPGLAFAVTRGRNEGAYIGREHRAQRVTG